LAKETLPIGNGANQPETNPFELTRDEIAGLIDDAHGCG